MKHDGAQSSRSSSRHGKRTPDGPVLGARRAEEGVSERITPTRETALVGDAYSLDELGKKVVDDDGQDPDSQENTIPVGAEVVAEQAEASMQAHPVSFSREEDSEPFLDGSAADPAPMPESSESVQMTDGSISLSPGPRLSVEAKYPTEMGDGTVQEGFASPDKADAPLGIDAKDASQTQAISANTTEDKPVENNTKTAALMHGDRGESGEVLRQGQFDEVHFAPMATPERDHYAKVWAVNNLSEAVPYLKLISFPAFMSSFLYFVHRLCCSVRTQVAIEDTSYPTEEYGIVPVKGRPSLRALRHRLSDHQDSFSSNGEVSTCPTRCYVFRGLQHSCVGIARTHPSTLVLMSWPLGSTLLRGNIASRSKKRAVFTPTNNMREHC